MDLPSASGLWIGTMGESGSNPSPDADRPSASPSRSEDQSGRSPRILVIEDNDSDVFLIRAALKGRRAQADAFTS